MALRNYFYPSVRFMEKYPWCDGIDIDLERGDDYSTHVETIVVLRKQKSTFVSIN